MNATSQTGQSQERQSGFSLVELIVSATLLAMMIYAVSTLAVSGGEAQEYARRLNRATEITHDVVEQMRTEMVSCVRIFGADTEGAENLALLDLSSMPAPHLNQRLPTIASTESPRRDTVGLEITGNTLFFAKLAWPDRFVCTSGREYMVDVYRWLYYYMTPEEGGPQPGTAVGLNLARFASEPLIDAASIDRITDATDQAEVLTHLVDGTPDADGLRHSRATIVWRRGALPSVAGTLRMIDDSDGSLSATPINGRPNPWSILLAQDTSMQTLLTYRHHSVATNYAQANYGVGRFGIVNNTGGGFPHGFEVQVVGPATSRQTLLHLVVASTNRRGHRAWAEVQVSVDSRDL